MTTELSARPQRRDALQNRQSILDAARVALAEDPAASLGAIAESAGLSRRALYGHFDDRDALIRELVDVGAERFNRIALGVHDDDPRVALARLAALLWREAAHVQVTAAIALDDAHAHDTGAALAPLRQRLAQIVGDGQNLGVLRTDVATATLARLIEEAARAVILRLEPGAVESGTLAVKAVMSIAGLSWRESVELLAQHPDLTEEQR